MKVGFEVRLSLIAVLVLQGVFVGEGVSAATMSLFVGNLPAGDLVVSGGVGDFAAWSEADVHSFGGSTSSIEAVKTSGAAGLTAAVDMSSGVLSISNDLMVASEVAYDLVLDLPLDFSSKDAADPMVSFSWDADLVGATASLTVFDLSGGTVSHDLLGGAGLPGGVHTELVLGGNLAIGTLDFSDVSAFRWEVQALASSDLSLGSSVFLGSVPEPGRSMLCLLAAVLVVAQRRR